MYFGGYKDTMEFYLIRHGESTNNRGDLPRVAEPPLTELGEEQARRAGESLKDEGITRLYCSPMLRVLHTAQFIGDILELPLHVFVGLHEWGGVWEERDGAGRMQLPGLTRSEMREILPNVVLPEDVTDQGWWFNEWEDVESMVKLAHENAVAFIAHLRAHHVDSDERVAAVSHGGSGSSLISALFDLPPDVTYARFRQNNTGVSRISITPEQTALHYLNRIDHLPAEVVTR
ncbi:MAG: histidine phosphatase family protein [Candidatus Poribacteria bacterium]|nr:histidine phosphatase family protein [Candidatus Poribacteria bacterium]